MIDERAKKLGETLVAAKILTSEQLEKAMELAQKEHSPSLIVSLLQLGFLTFKTFEKFVLSTTGIKSAILSGHDISRDLALRMGIELIFQKFALPISLREDKGVKLLALGMVDPTDIRTIKRIEERSGCKVIPILISLPDFKETLKKNESRIGTFEQIDLSVEEGSFVLFHGNYIADDAAIMKDAHAQALAQANAQARDGITLATSASVGSLFPPKLNPFQSLQSPPEASSGDDKTVALNEEKGSVERKFKEEVLLKLDLDPREALFITDSTYTRETLTSKLRSISPNQLQRIFNRTPAETKIEALINLLVNLNVVKKSDILISTAVEFVFKEGKK